MDSRRLAEVNQQFQETGSVLFPIGDSFLSDDDFDTLMEPSDQLPREFAETGDAGEPNHVMVGRFMTDKGWPEKVNRPLSDRAIEIVTQPAAMAACRELLDAEELHVRRMQVNYMGPGSFKAYHLDTENDPDYRAAVVLHFSEDFTGGEFVAPGGGVPPRVTRTTSAESKRPRTGKRTGPRLISRLPRRPSEPAAAAVVIGR